MIQVYKFHDTSVCRLDFAIALRLSDDDDKAIICWHEKKQTYSYRPIVSDVNTHLKILGVAAFTDAGISIDFAIDREECEEKLKECLKLDVKAPVLLFIKHIPYEEGSN